MTETMQRIRGYLEEMFGPERAAALDADAKPWHEAIGAKNLDVLDLKLFIARDFNADPGNVYFFEEASLAEIVAYIDAMTPSTFPH